MSKASNVKVTHVFNVNDTMVVADTIEEAIAVYRLHYTDSEVREVKQMYIGNTTYSTSYDALTANVVKSALTEIKS